MNKGGINIKRNYLSTTNLYSEAKRRLDELAQAISILKLEYEKSPDGQIHIVSTTKRNQFYHRCSAKEKSGKYIKKSEKELIRALLQKKYNGELLKMLTREYDNLSAFLIKAGAAIDTSRNAYSKYPEEVKEYIEPIDVSDEDYIKEWMAEPYKGKTIIEDNFTQRTDRGELVRSKSELAIANCLNQLGIPYKYESPLTLSNGRVIYPDFTVLDVKRRKEVYWEHRGMMDDKEYAKDSVIRIRNYQRTGIYLGDKLIITEETAQNPLKSTEIKDVIQHYFM